MLTAQAAALFEVPATTPSGLTASITDTLGSTGVLAFVIFIAALPLLFWIINQVTGLFPGQKENAVFSRDVDALEGRIEKEKHFLQDTSTFIKGFGKIGK